MTLTEEVAALLDELGVGTYAADGAPGGTIYLTALPSAPDVCMAIAPYGGGPDSDSRNPWDEPRLQVRTRGSRTDARTGEALAQQVYDALHGAGYRHLTEGGTWLQSARALQSGPVYMGRDETGRHEWVVNLQLDVERPTAHRAAH